MSHFVVVVVVPGAVNVDWAISRAERMLDPYNENIAVNAYKDRIVESSPNDWYMTTYLRQQHPDLVPEDPSWEYLIEAANMLEEGDAPYGIDQDGPFCWSTYNPESRWDWYVLGGRWRGYFRIREGGERNVGMGSAIGGDPLPDDVHSDACRKRDVDMDAWQADAALHANLLYDVVDEVVESFPAEVAAYQSWESIRDSSADIDEARNTYNDQPLVKVMHTVEELAWMSPDTLFINNGGREAYVQSRKDDAIIPRALLNADGWHEQGLTGWWGMVSDPSPDWPMDFKKLWDDIPDDAWVLAYDCHI